MEIEKQYVDSHGQSEVAFGFCQLLGFELLPRLKASAKQNLYTPFAGQSELYPYLEPVLTRAIDWECIRQQYEQLIKYATALRTGTAESEAILRRFTRTHVQHSAYKAFAELGKAVKTIFLCNFLGSQALRREVHEGRQVIDTWNSANGFIFYGTGGELATNRLENQELAMRSLHLLQICLIYVTTPMIQQVLAEHAWVGRFTAEDFRALTPLLFHHVTPYGMFRLNINERLALVDVHEEVAA